MRFGFRISRHLWLTLPWWTFPIVLCVLLGELMVYAIVLVFLALSALLGAVFQDRRRRR